MVLFGLLILKFGSDWNIISLSKTCTCTYRADTHPVPTARHIFQNFNSYIALLPACSGSSFY